MNSNIELLINEIDFSNSSVKSVIETILIENKVQFTWNDFIEAKEKFTELLLNWLSDKNIDNCLKTLIRSSNEGKSNVKLILGSGNGFPNKIKPSDFVSKSKEKRTEIITKLIMWQSNNVIFSLYKEIFNFHYLDEDKAISDDYDFLTFKLLTPEAKKNVALFHYKKFLWKKNPELIYKSESEQNTFIDSKITKLLKNLRKIRFNSNDYLEVLINYWLPREIRMMWEANIVNFSAEAERLKSSIKKIDYDDVNTIVHLMDEDDSNYDSNLNKYVFGELISSEELLVTLDETKSINNNKLENSKKPTLPYNPMLNDVKVLDRVAKLWEKQFIEIFEWFYWKIARKLIKEYWWILPKEFSTNTVIKSTLNYEEKEWEKWLLFKGSWLSWWSENNSWYDEKIHNIWIIMKSLIKDMKIYKKETLLDLDLDGIKKPLSWHVEHKSFFRENKYFEAGSLSYFKNDENEELIQFSISDELKMTDITYLIVQIWHFLKSWKIINREELYSKIFKEYTFDQNKSEKVHDISIFKDQYQKLFEHVIWPLSKEWRKSWVKPLSTLLAWSAWTWKSQFMINLLLKDKFELSSKKITLDAIAIWLSVNELLHVINNDKTVFNDIAEKTNLPVVVVIEDIDTPMREWKQQWWDPFSQGLTTLMTWLWSINVTFVSSTNHRRDFSPRLIRPWRFENIIAFPLPFNEEILDNLISIHSKINKLTKKQTDIVKSYIPKMEYFSTSYVAKFIEAIASRKLFKKQFDSSSDISVDEIDDIFRDIVIPLNDIIKDEKDLWLRTQSLKEKTIKSTIWFKK